MARSTPLFAALVLGAVCLSAVNFLAFVAAPSQPRLRRGVALQARGGGEYDISDADIQKFYEETMSGSGGPPPKGSVVGELIVKAFYGELKTTGFERYSGMWKGPPPGAIGKKDTKVAMEKLAAFMKETPAAMITKAGAPYGSDETQRVVDDGKGWVWLAADMSPGGLAMQMYTSTPYGKRPVMVAKKGQVDEMLSKINWDIMDKRVDQTMGGPHVIQR